MTKDKNQLHLFRGADKTDYKAIIRTNIHWIIEFNDYLKETGTRIKQATFLKQILKQK